MNREMVKEFELYGVSEDLDLKTDLDYETIQEHLNFHKFIINMNIKREVSISEAFFSWFENYYQPLFQAINKAKLWKSFEHLTKLQIFVNISTHWYYLKKENENIGVDFAVSDFAAQFASGSLQRFWYKMRSYVA